MTLARVAVLGGINMDTLAVSSAPTVATTSNPGRTTRSPGGVGRNVADNLSRLGSPTALIGAVGDDAVADEVLSPLAATGVDVSRVRRTSYATGSYTAVLEPTGELVVSVADMAATESLGPDDFAGWLAGLDANWLVLDGNLLPDTVTAVLQHAPCPVLLDPVGVAKAERLAKVERLPVHTFTPNVQELAAFTGIEDEAAAIAHCHDLGVEHVWLRAGARGSRIFGHDAVIDVGVVPGPTVDVTGAGDSMLAGFVHALNRGDDIAAAAGFGAALAALTIASPHPVRPGLTEALVDQTRHQQEVR